MKNPFDTALSPRHKQVLGVLEECGRIVGLLLNEDESEGDGDALLRFPAVLAAPRRSPEAQAIDGRPQAIVDQHGPLLARLALVLDLHPSAHRILDRLCDGLLANAGVSPKGDA